MTKPTMKTTIDAFLLDGPKTIEQLMVLMPNHSRSTFNGRLSELKSQNKARKNEKTNEWKWIRAGHLQKVQA